MNSNPMIKPVLELIRLEEDAQYGTFGVLKINKQVFCVTLEPADLENTPGRSSIPAQQYICIRHKSARFGETFQVMDVPGRTQILFHAGNVIGDTTGCILLGEHFGKLMADRAVLNSGKTFTAFMLALDDWAMAHLTIREVF